MEPISRGFSREFGISRVFIKVLGKPFLCHGFPSRDINEKMVLLYNDMCIVLGTGPNNIKILSRIVHFVL